MSAMLKLQHMILHASTCILCSLSATSCLPGGTRNWWLLVVYFTVAAFVSVRALYAERCGRLAKVGRPDLVERSVAAIYHVLMTVCATYLIYMLRVMASSTSKQQAAEVRK